MGATEKVFGNPQHPYTKMLLASVPQLHSKWEELDPVLKSQVAELAYGPAQQQPVNGDALSPESESTELVEVESDHYVAAV